MYESVTVRERGTKTERGTKKSGKLLGILFQTIRTFR